MATTFCIAVFLRICQQWIFTVDYYRVPTHLENCWKTPGILC